MLILLRHFLIGLSTSLLGSCPLSTLNLNAADMALHRPFKDVVMYALGVASLESIQIFIAIQGADWLSAKPQVDAFLQIVAVPVFVIMGAFFWHHGEKKQRKEPHVPTRLHPFLIGVVLATVNLLALPFWLFYTSLFYRLGWVNYTVGNEIAFVIGCWIATFAVLLFFARGGRFMAKRIGIIDNWSRHIIAVVFFILAIVQTVNIIRSDKIIPSIKEVKFHSKQAATICLDFVEK